MPMGQMAICPLVAGTPARIPEKCLIEKCDERGGGWWIGGVGIRWLVGWTCGYQGDLTVPMLAEIGRAFSEGDGQIGTV